MITAIALDSALINGTGADGQPLGLLNQPGLSVVSLGTNGAAPTKAANVQLKTNVAAANADFGNLAYLTNAQSRGKQEATVEVSGFPTWLWNDVPTGGVGELPMGRVQGTPAYVSQQVPSNLVKGGSGAVCSAQIYGNWQSAMIGRWSNALDIVVNPYSLDTTREIRISVSLMADVNFRWLPGFSAILDMLTT
jgi:HK97 family phage major capsid protein